METTITTAIAIGQYFLTNEGYRIRVLEETTVKVGYKTKRLFTVYFVEQDFILNNISSLTLTNGTLKNPYHPSVFGVGYMGVGEFTSTVNKELSRCYEVWQMMIGRCYCPSIQKRQPTYKGVTMVKEWHNFQNFAKWFYEHYVDGFDFNKNILIQGATMYAPESCCFVPKVITNTLIVRKLGKFIYPKGVRPSGKKFIAVVSKNNIYCNLGLFNTPELAFAEYKKAKENCIKLYAKEWKPLLKPNTYDALMKYQVYDYN